MATKGIDLTEQLLEPLREEFGASYTVSSSRVLFAIRALAQRINDDVSGWLAPFGLNAASYNYLIALYARKRPLTPNELRLAFHTTYSNVAQMIGSMEDAGIIRKAKNPNDGRSFFVVLTPKGVALARRVIPFNHRLLEQKLRRLSEKKRDQLMELLLEVNDGFDESESVELPA